MLQNIVQRRLLRRGGYLTLDYFAQNCEIPPLSVSHLDTLGLIWETPIWAIQRLLYWEIYEEFPDCDEEFQAHYSIWRLREDRSSSNDINKAIDYIKKLHSVLNRGWSFWGVDLGASRISSGFSFSRIRVGRIGVSGIRRSIKYSYETELLQKIEILTKDYVESICVTSSNQNSNSDNEGRPTIMIQESQDWYADVTVMFSGVGQLCQGRLLAGGIVFLSDIIGYIQCFIVICIPFFLTDLIGFIQCFFIIGVPCQIANKFLCYYDAKLYNKDNPKMTLIIIGLAINLIPLLLLLAGFGITAII